MLRTGLFSVCAILVISTAVHADVFKYVDEKGNVQYTDRPQKLPAERLSIQSQRTDIVELESREAAETKELAARNKARQSARTADTEKQKADELSAVKKAEACAKAREDYRVRATNWRLYEEDSKGERRYLTSAEIDAARDAAKKAMDDLCN